MGFYDFLNVSVFLFRRKITLRTKFKFWLTYFKLTLKALTLNKLFKLKNEWILGFKVSAFDYESICSQFTEIFIYNPYFFRTKRKAPVIFDCGANIGFATIFFKYVYPESKVYALEPDKQTFGMLKKNIMQNKLREVYLFNAAAWDEDGRIAFYIDKKKPGAGLMSSNFKRMPKDKIFVQGLNLGRLMGEKKIDFMKMDIEGSEGRVIDGLSRDHKLRNISGLAVEYHHKIRDERSQLAKFLKLFEDSGFEYHLGAWWAPLYDKNSFQDVMLYFYRI